MFGYTDRKGVTWDMGREMTMHTAWCIVRFANGRFERVREGYKSASNARRSIPALAKAYIDGGGDCNATYTVGQYTVGNVVILDRFKRYCA